MHKIIIRVYSSLNQTNRNNLFVINWYFTFIMISEHNRRYIDIFYYYCDIMNEYCQIQWNQSVKEVIFSTAGKQFLFW